MIYIQSFKFDKQWQWKINNNHTTISQLYNCKWKHPIFFGHAAQSLEWVNVHCSNDSVYSLFQNLETKLSWNAELKQSMCSAPRVSSSFSHSYVFQISQGWRSITQHHSVPMFAQSEVILLFLTFTWTVNVMAWPPGPENLQDSGTSNKVLITSWFFLIGIFLVKTGTMLQEVCAVWISRALLEPRGRNKHSLKSCESCCRHSRRAGAKIEIAVWQMIMMILIFPADICAFFISWQIVSALVLSWWASPLVLSWRCGFY